MTKANVHRANFKIVILMVINATQITIVTLDINNALLFIIRFSSQPQNRLK